MEPLAPTGSTGDPSTETVVPNPSPYVAPDTETDPEELLDLATIGAGVTQAISAAYAVDAAVALEAQRRVMADGDSDCPGLIDDYYAVYGYYYWYATCSTNLGASFDGYGYLYDVTNVDAGSYFAHEADYWYGLADLRTADDQRYEMTGTVWDYHYRYDSSAYDYYSWGVLGDFFDKFHLRLQRHASNAGSAVFNVRAAVFCTVADVAKLRANPAVCSKN